MIGFVLPLFPSLNGNLVIKYSIISFTLKNLSRDLPGHFLLSKTCCSSNQVSKELFWLLLLVVTQTRPRPSAATQDISKCIPRHTTQPQRADEKNMCSRKKKLRKSPSSLGNYRGNWTESLSLCRALRYIFIPQSIFFFFSECGTVWNIPWSLFRELQYTDYSIFIRWNNWWLVLQDSGATFLAKFQLCCSFLPR